MSELHTVVCYNSRNVYRFDVTMCNSRRILSGDSGMNVLLAGLTSRRLLSATSHQGTIQVQRTSTACIKAITFAKDPYL